MKLENKVAVVTGGAMGNGKGIVDVFVKYGAKVAILDYSDEIAKVVNNDNIIGFKVDIRDKNTVKAAIDKVVEKFGKIDILVNNAGITRDGLLMRMKESDWDAVLATNLKGVFNCTKAAVKYMMKQRSGKIVSISSVSGVWGNAGQANYAAAKAGILGFTKSVAKEVASRGICVNAVAPGAIKTPMTAVLSEKVIEGMLASIPLGRLGEPSDIAKAIVFLSSADSDYITGQTLHVDGGMVM